MPAEKWRCWWDKHAGEAPDELLDSISAVRDRPAAREMLRRLKDRTVGLRRREIVADVGCGTCAFAIARWREAGLIYALDVSEGMLRRAAERLGRGGVTNVRLLQASAAAIPLRSGSVDLAICRGVLKYLAPAEQRLALADLARILRPGGRLVVEVDNSLGLFGALQRLGRVARGAVRRPKTLADYPLSILTYFRVLGRAGVRVERWWTIGLWPPRAPQSWIRLMASWEASALSRGFRHPFGARLWVRARRL